MSKYKRLDKERPVVQHMGVFKKQLTTFEAIALIVSGTIGAGVLGIPYAVAKVGLVPGIIYIVVMGLLMMGINLLIGEVAVRTRQNLQLVGLTRKYLGKIGGWLMTGLFYTMLFGALLAYVIGEGETLSALFGGSNFFWSILFFLFGSTVIFLGMKTVKKTELILSLTIFVVVVIIASISAPHVSLPNFAYHDLAYILFPYGVLMFAFHSANTIPEAHSILINKDKSFKKVIFISSLITIVVYTIFAITVVGVTGVNTTEIATIGLGGVIGKAGFVLGNIFAALAMGTSFLVIGLSLKDSLSWDYKMPKVLSVSIVCGVPFIFFLFGLRSFIAVIDVIGGVLISLETVLIILIYWRAKQTGDLKQLKFNVHHAALLVAVLAIVLAIGTVYSVAKLF